MSLTATSRSVPGKLRQEVLVDGRFRLTTDEPARLGGDDSAPSPHELLPAALAACVSTNVLMFARMKSWELGLVEVDADYDPKATPPTCELVIHTEQALTDEQIARLAKVAASCPVRRALEGGAVEFSERIDPGTVSRPPLRVAG